LINLGDRLNKQGDVDGARAAYQQAIDSGHLDLAPKAMNNLGCWSSSEGIRRRSRPGGGGRSPPAHSEAMTNLGLLAERKRQ
jgi:hypothetical protein